MDCHWLKYIFVGISLVFHFMKNYRPPIKKLHSLCNRNLSRLYILFAKMRIIYVLKIKH